jgi:hypothetical protein
VRKLVCILIFATFPSWATIAVVDHAQAQATGSDTATATMTDTTGATVKAVWVAGDGAVNPCAAPYVISDTVGGEATTNLYRPVGLSDQETTTITGCWWVSWGGSNGEPLVVGATDAVSCFGGTKCSINVVALSGTPSGHYSALVGGQAASGKGDPVTSVYAASGVTPIVNNCMILSGLSAGTGTTYTKGAAYTLIDRQDYTADYTGSALAYYFQTTAQYVNHTWSMTGAGAMATGLLVIGPSDPFPQVTLPGEFSFLHIGDQHLGGSVYAFQPIANTVPSICKAWNCQALLSTGDFDLSSLGLAWSFGLSVTQALDIPQCSSPGNHDSEVTGYRYTSTFDAQVGYARCSVASSFGGYYDGDANTLANEYTEANVNGIQFLFVDLEFFPRNAIGSTWMDSVMDAHAAAHPGQYVSQAVLITHAYETYLGTPFTCDETYGPTDSGLSCAANMSGVAMETELKGRTNSVMSVSGHDTRGTATQHHAHGTATAVDSHLIQEFYTNYQGIGYWGTIYRFRPSLGSVEVSQINLKTGQLYNTYNPPYSVPWKFPFREIVGEAMW